MPLSNDKQITWGKVVETYGKAQESGAASKYKTHTKILTDQRLSLNFVLRVSDALRDKPKPPKSRFSTQYSCMSCSVLLAANAVSACNKTWH